MRVEIQHIGNGSAICNKRIPANLREDLGYERYRQLGVRERFLGQDSYRICGNCLRIVFARENHFSGRTLAPGKKPHTFKIVKKKK